MRALLLLLLSSAALAQSMPELVERYATDRSAVLRFHGMRLLDARYDRLARFYGDWGERLADVDFGALDVDARIDYVLLRTRIEYEKRQLARERARAAEARAALPFADAILALEGARRRLEPVDAKVAAERVAGLETLVKKARKDKVEGAKARRLSRATKELAGLLAAWYRNHAGYDPVFTWWVKTPYETVKRALDDHVKHLAKVGGEKDLSGEPIGAERMRERLALEMLPYEPQELIAMADKHYAWCEKEMRRAAEELGFQKDWREALEHVKRQHVAPGKQAAFVADVAREAVAFCDRHDLVTIPALCRETWRTEMISARGQRSLPFASYGGQRMNVAFATEGMTHEQKLMSMRGNNRHFTRLVTPHELIPGHHLQGFLAGRVTTHRRAFRTAFLVEGWAVYTEMLFWKLGFARSPEDRIGHLFWRMHRCARINVSLRYHLGEMTTAQMIDYLIEHVGHERENATAEVRRYVAGSYGPLYQAAYLVGALQLRELRKEVVDGGKMSDRQFHDLILAQNSIPIEMVRAAILETPLERDHRAAWKFGGG